MTPRTTLAFAAVTRLPVVASLRTTAPSSRPSRPPLAPAPIPPCRKIVRSGEKRSKADCVAWVAAAALRGVGLLSVLCVSFSMPTAAWAGQYAAMKQVDVKGGQLRLVKGVDVTVPGADGPRQVRQIAFPLKHTSMQVRVAGMMAHTTVTQTFANPFSQPIEAVYLFPLGDQAAVSSYEIIIGERVIKGKIKTRAQAQRIYRRAKAKGHTAGLLQQEKANIFSQRIANIAAGKGYFVLMVQPKGRYRTGDIAPREVLLLIDVSGSMGGRPLAHAKAVAKGIIAHLGPRDTFNVMSFSSGTRAMSRRPTRASAKGKAAGLRWVDNLRPGGGTELERAVVRSLKRRPGADRIRMVYLLTDGYVGNDKVILATARRHLVHNRIFPVGVGSAPNRFLLNRLADVGRGFPSYITLRESPKRVLKELVRRSTHPYLTDVKIRFNGLAVHDLVPQRIPDVYAGLPLVIAGRYRKGGGVRSSCTPARPASPSR